MRVGAASASDRYVGQPPGGCDEDGSRRWLEALYRSHSHELRRYIAARFGPGPPEPEEVTQAAFAKLTANQGPPPDDAARYLYAIARNIVFDYHRSAAHEDAARRDLFARADSMSEITPERVLLDRERVAVFEATLKRMPAMRRRIFLMVRVHGEAPKELAHRFRVSESAIHKHVLRALKDCTEAFKRAENGRRPR